MASRDNSQAFRNQTGPARFKADRRFWLCIGLGLAVLFFVALLYDAPVTRALMNWPDGERAFFEWLTRWGKSDWILIPALFMAVVAYLGRGLHLSYSTRWTLTGLGGLGWYIFIGVGAPGLTANLLKRLFGRARPMHLDELGTLSFQPIQSDWSLASFPSGHATTGFAIAVIMSSIFPPRFRWLFFTFAVLIALSRVVTGMHYMTDVVAGAALGTFGAVFVRDWFAVRRFPISVQHAVFRNRAWQPVKRLIGRRID